MVDKVKFGGQKDRPDAENEGQNRGAYLLTLKEGVPPPGIQDSRFLLYQQYHTNGSTIMTKTDVHTNTNLTSMSAMT